MYLFRLAQIGSDQMSNWFSDAAIFTHIDDPDDSIIQAWVSTSQYQVGEYVSRNHYVYISIKNNNSDDPHRNYVGRPPEWGDIIFGYCQNSWLRVRLLSKYLCFNLIQPGYTWSSDGYIDFTFKPSDTIYGIPFFGAGNVQTPTYVILSDIVGSSITLSILDASDSVIRTETIALDTSKPMVTDWVFNPELPGISRNTIIRPFDRYTGAYALRIQITPPTEEVTVARAGIGGCYIGRATKIGQTQQDKLSFGYNDLSIIGEDEWGQISLSKGRVAKKIEADVFVETSKADAAFKLMQYVRSTPTFFLFSNNLAGAITTGTVISGLTSIMGLVTNTSQGRTNARQTSMSVTVEAIPSSFTDVAQLEPETLCGMPPLPVVPVVDDTPTNPSTPPVSGVAVTGVTLSKTTLSAYAGKYYYLYATVLPSNAGNKSVTWASSNTSIATVTSTGGVLGKVEGSCTITVTTNEGSFTASCAVTVKVAVAPPPEYDSDVMIFYELYTEDSNVLQFIYPME